MFASTTRPRLWRCPGNAATFPAFRRFLERTYEGEEFPGFLAIRHGEAIIGLQRASPEQPAYLQGLRWQFELETVQQVDEVIATCRPHRLKHQVTTERGGDRFLTRLVSVTSPSGVTVWFEGPNEAGSTGA